MAQPTSTATSPTQGYAAQQLASGALQLLPIAPQEVTPLQVLYAPEAVPHSDPMPHLPDIIKMLLLAELLRTVR